MTILPYFVYSLNLVRLKLKTMLRVKKTKIGKIWKKFTIKRQYVYCKVRCTVMTVSIYISSLL